MYTVGVVDYSVGNIFSVYQACSKVGLKPSIVKNAEDLKGFDALILPGVGAFGKAIQNLKERGLEQEIRAFINTGKPFMGICLGMQLLLTQSEEFGTHRGLNLIEGRVKSFRDSVPADVFVPKITWDSVNLAVDGREHALKHVRSGSDDFYFVHSYYCEVDNEEDILSFSEYGGIRYASSVLRENIFGTQFHPEKSGELGIEVYKNWKNNF